MAFNYSSVIIALYTAGLLIVSVFIEKVSAQNCTGVVCNNGGVCNSFTASPPCICPLPYIPPYCSAAANYCNTLQPEKGITSLPVCLNGGNCTMGYSDPYFNCTCTTGFTGIRCNESVPTTVSVSGNSTTALTATPTLMNCTVDCTAASTLAIAIGVCVTVVVIIIVGTLVYLCVFKKTPNRVFCQSEEKDPESQENVSNDAKHASEDNGELEKRNHLNPVCCVSLPREHQFQIEVHSAQESEGRGKHKHFSPERNDGAHGDQDSKGLEERKDSSQEQRNDGAHGDQDFKGQEETKDSSPEQRNDGAHSDQESESRDSRGSTLEQRNDGAHSDQESESRDSRGSTLEQQADETQSSYSAPKSKGRRKRRSKASKKEHTSITELNED